jgi:hypothetical protein
MNSLNRNGQQFVDALASARVQFEARKKEAEHTETVHVVGAGGALTAAYEQLRNSAEYTEEHLLLQRAIRRFYQRLFLSRDKNAAAASGEELIVELTLAGYLSNDSVAHSTIESINALASRYYAARMEIGLAKHRTNAWTLDVLAVEIELLLNDSTKQDAFVDFCHRHFAQSINQAAMFGHEQSDFEVALFVAVHRALLRSDEASIRVALLRRYNQSPEDIEGYKTINLKLDALFASETTDKLFRFVRHQGAPLRVLWRMVDENGEIDAMIQDQAKFLSAYELQIANEYDDLARRINRGIVKSVVFLFITKFLIGLAIEVPYDLMIHGSILWLALGINLLFPPTYMVLLRLTMTLPGTANTHAMVDAVDKLLYGQGTSVMLARQGRSSFGVAYNIAYSIFFVAVFGGVSVLLWNLGFSFVHLIIFFIFLSTASFLGFRLSRQVRDLEVVEADQNSITTVRDFLYMPFVIVGRWISDRYASVNVVAMVLDMMIELPLKTVLRLLRQWSAFITSKKDEL